MRAVAVGSGRVYGRSGGGPAEPLEPRLLFAGLSLDLRLAAGGGKSADVAAGQVVAMELYAIVTGADTSTANEGFQFAWGSLLSSPVSAQPLLSGSLAATPTAPFNDLGSQAGAVQDLDGDGDLDVGSNATSADTSYLFARADAMQAGGSFKVADVIFTVPAGAAAGQQTRVNFRPAAFAGTFVKSALWREDGAPEDNTTGTVGAGTDVVLIVNPTPPPPAVTEVYVSGSAWTATFKNHLQALGTGSSQFGFRVTAADQLNELPWANVNQVSVRFDRAVNIDLADVQVRGVTRVNHAPTSVTYDAAANTATIALPAAVLNDKVLLVLDGDAGGVSAQVGGRLLDGEWAGGGLGLDTFPSGNGTAGGDFLFRLNVVPGDVDRNGAVNIFDTLAVRNRQGTSTTSAGTAPTTYSAFHDVDGNAAVNIFDTLAARNRQGTSLPAGEPTAGVASSALFGEVRLAVTSVVGQLKELKEDEAVLG